MTTQRDLINAQMDVEAEKRNLKSGKDGEKIFKTIFKAGLVGIAYMGVRNFVGPELDIDIPKYVKTLDYFDAIGTALGMVGGGIGGVGYGLMYLTRNISERNLKRAEGELERLTEEYNKEGKK